MIRCIAVDLDDTLLRKDLTISTKNQAAIKAAIAAGVKVLLASGRMFCSMKPYARELGMDLPLISYNGALIREANSGKELYHQPVPRAETLQVLEMARRTGIHLNVYLNDTLYMDELTVWGENYAKVARVTPHPVGDVTKYLEELPHKILAIGEPERVDWLKTELVHKFGNKLNLVKSKPIFLEILAPGVSKGKSLTELTKLWGIDQREVMAIGDAPNDLAMIEWAGVGVAIGNADTEVKASANLVVSDHEHDGVAEAIERYL